MKELAAKLNLESTYQLHQAFIKLLDNDTQAAMMLSYFFSLRSGPRPTLVLKHLENTLGICDSKRKQVFDLFQAKGYVTIISTRVQKGHSHAYEINDLGIYEAIKNIKD